MSSHEVAQAVGDAIRSGGNPSNLEIQFKILGTCITLFWVLEIVDSLLLRGALNRYGIRPRRLIGLRGIVLAPFLHGDLKHLAANTLPFITLGWLVMLRDVSDFFIVSAIAGLVGGLGVWLLGASNSVHIGASGLIFGYFGFLLLRGYFEQNPISIAISVLVGLLYGGLIWGVLPIRRGMSWQGHLFGFAGGVLAARWLPEIKQWILPFWNELNR